MTSERYLQRFLVGAKMRMWSGRVGKLANATDLVVPVTNPVTYHEPACL